jgi:LDH2 family malate/lactate/ureidoglycolate dehydrogenase
MGNFIAYDDLIRFTESVLTKGLGYSEEEAEITSRVLAEADARSVPSHGVSRLAFYRMNRDKNFARPGASPEIVWETPCSLVVDGHDGIGAYVSEFCAHRVIEKAKSAGTGFCAARNSNHYGIAGYWAEMIAKNDMIGMAFTNTRTCAIPTYGRRRILGTNPIAVGIPEGGRRGGIFLLDMATTTVAHGKVEVYDRRKKPMPLGWAVDENGVGTTDATSFEKMFLSSDAYGGHLFLGGEGEENGGHKGFGLGLLVELLCSGMSIGMSTIETFQPGQGSGITHFFGAMRLDLFGDPAALKKRVGEILDAIRDSEKATGQDRIYIHGEKETESRDKAMRDGVFIDGATREYLESIAAEFAIERPKWM